MRTWTVLLVATAVAAAVLGWGLWALDVRSAWFAFLVVWVPMTWLGTISRVVTPRLPDRYHALRSWEGDGRAYELLGVQVVKWLLRRGPMAVFNPDLHLPKERTPDRIARLDQRMRDAEASHAILLALTLGLVVHAAVRGWWASAGWILLFDVLLNGYPVMLQRYNRAGLARRFGPITRAGRAVG